MSDVLVAARLRHHTTLARCRHVGGGDTEAGPEHSVVRSGSSTALQMAEHRIRAEAGQRMQVMYASMLQDGWPALVEELERRWSEPGLRAAWCDMVARRAVSAFGRTPWTIEHPASWTDDDGERLGHALAGLGVPSATFVLDASATAGLRVRHGTACLDATIDGLLAERARVEGRLLAAWEQATLSAEGAQND